MINHISRRTLLKGASAASLAIALGSRGAMAQAGGQFKFYSSLTGSKEAAGRALVDAFLAANPGTEVEMTLLADLADSNTKVLTAIASGTVPDVVFNHYYFATNYASGGHLLDLNPKMAGGTLKPDDIDPRLLASGQFEGQQISVPLYASSRVLLYRTQMLEDAGLDPASPPKNWAELREWANKLTIRDGGVLKRSGLLLLQPPFEYGQNFFALLVWGAGGELLSADGKKAAFNTDAGREALQFWRDMIREDGIYEIGFLGGPGGGDPFIQGTAAMQIGLNPTAFFARRAKIDFGAMPIPGRDGGTISLSDPLSLYIMKNGENTELAWKFIEFALSEEQQVSFCKSTLNLPALKVAQQSPEITGIPELKPFIDALDVARELPITPAYTEIWDAISSEVEAALTDTKPVDEALGAAEERVNTILGRF